MIVQQDEDKHDDPEQAHGEHVGLPPVEPEQVADQVPAPAEIETPAEQVIVQQDDHDEPGPVDDVPPGEEEGVSEVYKLITVTDDQGRFRAQLFPLVHANNVEKVADEESAGTESVHLQHIGWE